MNGKRYIGQKKFDNGSRWKSYIGSGYHLQKAINKYGKDNFKRDIVDIAFSENELNEKEREWIKNYNAVEDKSYYNMIDGGNVTESLLKKNSISVICIDNNRIFDSLVDASIWSGYTVTKIKKSFKLIHDKEKYKSEDFIFRPYAKLHSNEKLCCICGKIFKREHNAQKKCNRCRGVKGTTKTRKKRNKSKMDDSIKRKRVLKKEQLIETLKESIIDLYINKELPISTIVKEINLKGIDNSLIKRMLSKWNIELRDDKSNKFTCYIATYDTNNNLIKVFSSKLDTRNWINITGLCETRNFSNGQLSNILRNGKQYKGYIFKRIDENTYYNLIK